MPRHERVLPVRQPQRHRFAQGFGPPLGLGDEAPHLGGRRGDQRLGEPHPLPGQLPDHIEGLVTLLGLKAVDREDDLIDRFVLPQQGIGVLLARGEHPLVAMDVLADGVIRERDPIGVEEFGSDLGDGPVPREPAMADPAEDVPADGPMGWGDGRFDLRALGLGMPGAMGIGTMIELADQFHRAFEGVQVAKAVIADVHPAATGRTVAIEDVELPGHEIGIRRPSVGHRADLQVLRKSSGRRIRTRGYARSLAFPSHLSGRC